MRQAAAAALQVLAQLPALQPQEQRPPAQQLRGVLTAPGGWAGPVGGMAPGAAAGTASSAATAPAAASAKWQLGGSGSADLQAVINERRRQLRESGRQQAAPVEVFGGTVGGGPKAAATAMAACRASSTGSAEGEGEGEGEGRIHAWPSGNYEEPEVAELHHATAVADARPSRPPSADVFETAAQAMQWLDEEAQPPARKRRGWVSQPPSPPLHAAAASDSPPAAVASQQHLGQQQMWRENPLAQSVEAAGHVGAAAAAPASMPCVHHVQHAQVRVAGNKI